MNNQPLTNNVRVRFHIIRNARIENVGKSQSCMVSKLRIIWKQTVASTRFVLPFFAARRPQPLAALGLLSLPVQTPALLVGLPLRGATPPGFSELEPPIAPAVVSDSSLSVAASLLRSLTPASPETTRVSLDI